MIRFALKCPEGHVFESWFKSSEAFDSLAKSGMVTCPDCGSVAREKALMAPDVRTSRRKEEAGPQPAEAPAQTLATSSSEVETALSELRKKVQENSEYVGPRFAEEARAIHLGTSKERAIYGEASKRDAAQLIEDGIPVAPLPFIPTRKTN